MGSAQNKDLVLHNVSYISGFFFLIFDNNNKSAKLTQIKYVVFVVNSMVMTTFLGSDTTNSVFGQFKGHSLGVGGFGRL